MTLSQNSDVAKTIGEHMDKQRVVDGYSPWWHSIDLGDGVVTPGRKSQELLRSEWENLRLPDLAGMSVLDIGAWDGYFSFMAERSGAHRVLALDDFVWNVRWESFGQAINSLRHAGAPRTRIREQVDSWDPVNSPGKQGFDICKRFLNSRVESMCRNYMELGPADIGKFDVVLYLGVLYHEPNPIASLEKVFSLCRKLAVIETHAVFFPGADDAPKMEFYPEDELSNDPTNWWGPNMAAAISMARVVGFTDVRVTVAYPDHLASLNLSPSSIPYRLTMQCFV